MLPLRLDCWAVSDKKQNLVVAIVVIRHAQRGGELGKRPMRGTGAIKPDGPPDPS